ncbi:MAG TPA: 50S ribosomal protein L6 [Spirochaetota bacterium]|nr:50S ribosomal protein L6 [Spirochaetota bacterium]HNT11247.1 50S ribosomal protein L6 [Spirochaetota bacterium]HNV48529.1 50S ribosomal protein L6 [Spirochaetota bacterium]HOS41244.1 50S ribosomal protein L6 [Spirochaetota bacterium]HPU88936.1 50S ribosomal protein L6 [Spirochaetota bacterium]
MSRIGNKPLQIPGGVTVEVSNNVISVKGPLGSDSQAIHASIGVTQKDGTLLVEKLGGADDKATRASHGLYRSLIGNMLTGVSKGFERELEIVGVGYRAQQQSKDISFQLGYSHAIVFPAPDGITLEVVEPTRIRVKGVNKQQVGQVAANIRELRPPEPYKGKGIKYKDEYIRRKAGKTGA